MRALIKRFWSNDAGAMAIEYAAIGAFLSVLIVAGATSIGSKLSADYQAIADAYTG